MIRKFFYGLSALFILLMLWINVAYAFYPFCEDIRIVYYGKAGSLLEKWALVFREELTKRFNFKDKVEVVSAFNLQIWSKAVNQAFADGKLDIAIVPAGTMVKTVPNFRILTFPGFVVRDYEIESLQSKRKFLNLLGMSADKYGVPLLGVGWRYATLTSTQSKPFTSLSDLKGSRFAVKYPGERFIVDALGAQGVYMQPPEVYAALSKKAVDGTISNYISAARLGQQQMIKSIISFKQGGFDSIAYVLIIREELFNKPDNKARKLIKKAAQIASKEFTALMRTERENAISRLKEYGVKVNLLQDRDYKVYRDKLEKNLWPKLIQSDQERNLLGMRKDDIK